MTTNTLAHREYQTLLVLSKLLFEPSRRLVSCLARLFDKHSSLFRSVNSLFLASIFSCQFFDKLECAISTIVYQACQGGEARNGLTYPAGLK